MTEGVLPVVILVTPLISLTLTYAVRRYALRKGVLDIPNSRSSHSIPTPRGGGVAFVIVFISFVIIVSVIYKFPRRLTLGLVCGSLLIASVGWLDDKGGLSVTTRAITHLVSAALATDCIGGLPTIRLGPAVVKLGITGSLLAILGIAWGVNLYNFMDGIDGIAGSEAVTVATFGGLLSLVSGNSSVALLCFGLALSVAGFLYWNWPPAKIFMGDVGSGFLGFVFAYIALWSERTNGVPLVTWLILLAVFVVDATLTLVRRVISGERWYEAHRSHVYQLAVQEGYSHRQVTVTVVLLNAMLAGAAFISVYIKEAQFPVLIFIYLCLGFVHWYLRARWGCSRKFSRSQSISTG